MQVKKQQLELDMEQQTGSNLGEEYVKALYCHPAYLTYMQSIPCEILGWMKHKLEFRLLGEISVTSDMQMTPPLLDFSVGSHSKVSTNNVGDLGSISGSGRSPGKGNGNPLQYSFQKIPWMEERGRLQSMGSQRVGHY